MRSRDAMPRSTRTRARVLAGVVLAAALFPITATPVLADPTYPSADAVARSKAAVAARAADVATIEGRLAAADIRLQRVSIEVAQAVEAYDGARYRLQLAAAAALTARAQADAADGAVQTSRVELGRFAAASYRSGGGLAGIDVLLGAQSVDDLARRTAVLQILGGQRDASLRRVQAAGSVARVLRGSADAAFGREQQAAAAVDAARQAAEAKLAGQQAAVAAIQSQRQSLLASLAAARRTSVSLEQARLSGLARERQARAEAARRAAARAAAAAARRHPTSPPPGPGGGGTSTGTTAGARAAIAYAEQQLGAPYEWGATGPSTFDCSGLTMQAWARGGVSLPHYSVAQYEASAPVALGNLRPGDLVFFASDPSDYHSIYHVGLFVGNGTMIEAPYTGESVRYSSIWRASLFGAARP